MDYQWHVSGEEPVGTSLEIVCTLGGLSPRQFKEQTGENLKEKTKEIPRSSSGN